MATLDKSIHKLLESTDPANALGTISGPKYTTNGNVVWRLYGYRVDLTKLVDLVRKHHSSDADVALVPSFVHEGSDIQITYPRYTAATWRLLLWWRLLIVLIWLVIMFIWLRTVESQWQLNIIGPQGPRGIGGVFGRFTETETEF